MYKQGISLQDLSRQALIVGTTRFTNPLGDVGYSNESLQVSALVRIADALEQQNQFSQQRHELVLERMNVLERLNSAQAGLFSLMYFQDDMGSAAQAEESFYQAKALKAQLLEIDLKMGGPHHG